MEFAFTDEQNMIRESAETFLREVSTSAAIREAMETDAGFQSATWRSVCEDLCWSALPVPEAFGGLGLGMVELISMQEQMGRFLFCSPFFSSVCCATVALLVAGTEDQKAQVLPQLVAGKTATLAFVSAQTIQPQLQWQSDWVDAHCKVVGDEIILNGHYRFVVDGASADRLIVAAREDAQSPVRLFLVDALAPGLTRTLLPTLDQTRKQAQIILENVTVPASAEMVSGGDSRLQTILDLATIALAAEQMGGAQRVLELAVDYTKEREQFGRPVAGFQAIKHKAADMMMRVEVARSGVYYAACVADEALQSLYAGTAVDRYALAEAASVAKSYCSDAFFKNASDCLQMHGGVGFTWEYDVHLFFKRAKASEHFLGNGTLHRERLAALLLDAATTLEGLPEGENAL